MSTKPLDNKDVFVYRISDIASYIINRYIETYEEYIYKNDNGKYVFTKMMSDRDLRTTFNLFFNELVNSDRFPLGSKMTIVVGGSYPFLNWRKSKYSDIVTQSSKDIIRKQLFLNYVMRDRSIVIDEHHFCKHFNEWVYEMIEDNTKVTNRTNVHFFYNASASEIDLIRTTRVLYGTSRVELKDIDTIKSICELSECVYRGIDDNEIPTKVFDELKYYMALKITGIIPEGGDDNGEDG